MPVYLGTLGRMVKLPYVTAQQVETEERYSFQQTLEGRRKAQVKPRGPRTWALATEHFRPNEVALLQQFAQGTWGPGPFVFVSADAPVSNLLTPRIADCFPEAAFGANVMTSGELYIGHDMYAPRSLINSNPSTPMYFGGVRTPVVAGKRVTGSAWVSGADACVRLFFYNAAGTFISSATSGVTATQTTVVRSWVTAMPPAGAVSCVVGGVNATRATQPAVTWTDGLLPWADGQGCEKAVVHGVSRDLRLAMPGATYLNLGFTVSEVG